MNFDCILPEGAGEPVHPLLHGGAWITPACPPDPLAGYRWEPSLAADPLAPLQSYYLRPVAWKTEQPGSFEGLETLSGRNSALRVTGPGEIRFDFGLESAGWLEFESGDFHGDVELSISEYDQPGVVNVGAQHPVKTDAPILEKGTWRLKLNREYYEGVRFGWVHIRRMARPFTIRNFRCACQAKPANYAGSFHSDNALFDRIWGVAAYGVRVNFLAEYIGAILMERSDRYSWTGDAYTSQMAALCAFDNAAFVKHNLTRTARDANSIASYSLYWIFSLLDYIAATGDLEYARGHLSLLREKMNASGDVIRWHSNLVFMGHDDRLGAFAEEPNLPSNRWNYRMIHLRACRELAVLAGHLGEEGWAADLRSQADAGLAEARATGGWPDFLSLHSAADAINAGALSTAEAERAFEHMLSHPVHRISYSPFNQYFLIDALGRLGRHNDACHAIERCWGGMLALGATCFFESYRPEWNDVFSPHEPLPNGMHGYTSFCHPWGAGVLRWMQERLAGLRPVAPGWSHYLVAPAAQEYLSQIEAVSPTPRGPVKISADFEGGQFTVEGPPGGAFILPFEQVASVQVNGRNAVPEIDKQGRAFVPVGGEITRIEARPPGRRVVFAAPSIRYDAEWLGLRSGGASAVKGSGRVLFAAGPGAMDICELPSSVGSVRVSDTKIVGTPRRERIDLNETDARAFILEGKPVRSALRTINPGVCLQTFTVDVCCREPVTTHVYAAAWEEAEIVQTLEVFDLDTLDLVLPTKILRDFSRGIWASFRSERSVRVRICHVRGPDATLSALVFSNS